MTNCRQTPAFINQYPAQVIALLTSARAELSEALKFIDHFGDMVCGAHIQTAIDGLDFAITERLHDND